MDQTRRATSRNPRSWLLRYEEACLQVFAMPLSLSSRPASRPAERTNTKQNMKKNRSWQEKRKSKKAVTALQLLSADQSPAFRPLCCTSAAT